MGTKAQANNLAKARAAKAAKAAQVQAEADSMVGKLHSEGVGGLFDAMNSLSPEYIRASATTTAPMQPDLATYGQSSRETLQAETQVPGYDYDEVQSMKAELESLRAERQAAAQRIAVMEQTISNQPPAGRDAFGRPIAVYPEPAEDYVARKDMPTDLDFFNSEETRQLALLHGRPDAGRTKILHSNSVTKWEGGALQAATFWMYAKDGTARRIMRQSVESAKHSGLSTSCPKCGSWHKESELDPNACPKRARHNFTLCPVCEAEGIVKPIYDTPSAKPLDEYGREVELDLAAKQDPNYVSLANELPASYRDRLIRRVQDHIRAFHESTAAAMHLQPFQKVGAGQEVV